MRNQYLENLCKIEFVVTYACTGRCKHCSEGEHTSKGGCIDADIAADAVRKIAAEYAIETVMAFGGEPLLYPDTVQKIMTVAAEMGVSRRQVITNGYFSTDEKRIREVAEGLRLSGVNDLLLSVDAFHQETIPLALVKTFAKEAKRFSIPIRLSPAWLVSREDGNPYNQKTREILCAFGDMGIPIGEGNVVFPEGNARRYLSEYFKGDVQKNPYVEDPRDVRCVSFSPNGDVLNGNAYRCDVAEILREYAPKGEKR